MRAGDAIGRQKLKAKAPGVNEHFLLSSSSTLEWNEHVLERAWLPSTIPTEQIVIQLRRHYNTGILHDASKTGAVDDSSLQPVTIAESYSLPINKSPWSND